jgi:hypothetical protein
MVSPLDGPKGKAKKKRQRFGINVIVEQNIHQQVKNYTDNQSLEIQEFVSDRLYMLLEKIEFNKKYLPFPLKAKIRSQSSLTLFILQKCLNAARLTLAIPLDLCTFVR